jgi:hypothetical protein
VETGYFDNNRCPAAKDSHVLSIHSQQVNMVQRIPRQQNLFNFGLVKLETCQLCCEFITSLPTCGELAIFWLSATEVVMGWRLFLCAQSWFKEWSSDGRVSFSDHSLEASEWIRPDLDLLNLHR